MNAREYILQQVKINRPEVNAFTNEWSLEKSKAEVDKLENRNAFIAAAQKMGSNVMDRANAGLWLKQEELDQRTIRSYTHEFDFASSETYPEIIIAKGLFGVAENASVWVSDNEMPALLSLFTCVHLVIVLDNTCIVGDMHDGYKKVADLIYQYGVFIAGPSKTADIEQVLVTGAHGPKKCTIVII